MAHKITLVLLTLAVFETTVTLALRKEKGAFRQHNEQCVIYDHLVKCDSSQGLMCLDAGLKGYRCLCPANKLHAQYFDTKRSVCVGKVFNACVRGNSRETLNETLCADNAECNTSVYGLPICLCMSGYTENDDGTCGPSLRYGDSCDNGTDDTSAATTEKVGRCDDKSGQVCTNGKCQCKYPTEQYYDQVEEKCISYAGGRCSQDRQVYSCVPNSNCPVHLLQLHKNPSIPQFLGGPGAVDGDEIFVMPLRPPSRPHLPPIPQRPHPPFHSHHPLLSKQDPLIEFDTGFDNFDFSARSIIFGPQGSASGEEPVLKKFADEFDQPRCQCLPGFSRTADGFCMRGYGSKCNPDDDSINATGGGTRELCNPDQFLECLDAHDGSFVCQCRNPLSERYDTQKQMCVGIVGRRCRPMGNYPKCDTGAECINGMCQCANGTSLTPLETCAVDYNETCDPATGKVCNVYRGLTCHGKSKTCLCIDSYLRHDPKKGACVASKDSPCGSIGLAVKPGNFVPDAAYIECEEGLECKIREFHGKRMTSSSFVCSN